MGLDVNAGVATESKVMVGSETEMVGVTEKSEVTVGSEVEMVGGTESGVDMEVQTDLEQNCRCGGRCRSWHEKCDHNRQR